MERARDLADGHAIAMRPANGSVIVHRKHILDLRGEWFMSKKTTLRGGCWGGPFYALISPWGWSVLRAHFHTAHDRRYHRHSGTSGHVGQGRFQAFPIQDDDHLFTVLRYVERNALRADLVARAEAWAWSSLPGWLGRDPLVWRGGPPIRGPDWLARVNEPLSVGDLQRLRRAVARGRPFGDEAWARATAERLGLGSCLRPRGRSRKGQP
jgi:putative transposase